MPTLRRAFSRLRDAGADVPNVWAVVGVKILFVHANNSIRRNGQPFRRLIFSAGHQAIALALTILSANADASLFRWQPTGNRRFRREVAFQLPFGRSFR